MSSRESCSRRRPDGIDGIALLADEVIAAHRCPALMWPMAGSMAERRRICCLTGRCHPAAKILNLWVSGGVVAAIAGVGEDVLDLVSDGRFSMAGMIWPAPIRWSGFSLNA